jgi:hypothetical protein
MSGKNNSHNMVMYQESFRKNPNIEQIAPKLFVYRNFIKGDLLDRINSLLENHIESPTVDHNVDWYHSRFTVPVPEMHEVWEQASELIYPELSMHPQLCLLKAKVGDEGMYYHSDAPGKPHEDCGPICGYCDIASKVLISPDAWNTCCRLHYGLIVYFGEFEGGEVYYPNLNRNGEFVDNFVPFHNNEELRVKPGNGDLIIHGAHGDYCHGVREVTNGVRFAFSNFVIPSHTNPGTFYNYKTSEYKNQIKYIKENPSMRWNDWTNPVNGFVWQEPEAVLEDKKNGITGVRYRDLD